MNVNLPYIILHYVPIGLVAYFEVIAFVYSIQNSYIRFIKVSAFYSANNRLICLEGVVLKILAYCGWWSVSGSMDYFLMEIEAFFYRKG